MDPQVQTSFIPKKSLDVSASRGGGGHYGLLFLVAMLIFVASLAAAAGSFLYTNYLKSAIDSKSKSLALAEGAYDPGVIQDLLRMDNRFNQSKKLLASHVAVTGIFNFLSLQTLEQVSFSNFDYSLDSDGKVKMTLQGTANSFSTVALQSDQFGGSKLLKNVVFSGITVDATTGKVNFSVTADVDPSVTSYSKVLGGDGATSAIPGTPTTPPIITTPAGAPPASTTPH